MVRLAYEKIMKTLLGQGIRIFAVGALYVCRSDNSFMQRRKISTLDSWKSQRSLRPRLSEGLSNAGPSYQWRAYKDKHFALYLTSIRLCMVYTLMKKRKAKISEFY